MASSASAGAIAGFVEVVMVQPLDFVKTRFQLYEQGRNPSVARALIDVYREGGFLRFYRGFLPEAASTMPARTAMYTTYNLALDTLCAGSKPTAGLAFVAGCCAGPVEAAVVTPLQLVKVRLQSKDHLGRYRNALDCCRRVYAEEGLQAMFTGFGATAGRNTVWNGVYFGLVFQFKALSTQEGKGPLMSALTTSGASFVSGFIATCFNAPFDTAKSRIQQQLMPEMQAQGSPAALPKYRGTFQTLGLVLQQEGPGALYKGFVPKALRMAFGGAIGMPIFEAVSALLAPSC